MSAEDQPHAPRRVSPLRNGNRQGDFRNAPRCGAKTRQGHPCRGPCIHGRHRCRMHGGQSNGPNTLAGLERSRMASWKSGRYSASALAEQREVRFLLRESRQFLANLWSNRH